MTGLDLESFLHLLRADLGAWAALGAAALALAAIAWTTWGSRKALRKCLVLSVAAHVGLLIFGGTLPANGPGGGLVQAVGASGLVDSARVRVRPVFEGAGDGQGGETQAGGKGPGGGGGPAFDRPSESIALADAPVPLARPERSPSQPAPVAPAPSSLPAASAAPEVDSPAPSASPEDRPVALAASEAAPDRAAPADVSEIAQAEPAPSAAEVSPPGAADIALPGDAGGTIRAGIRPRRPSGVAGVPAPAAPLAEASPERLPSPHGPAPALTAPMPRSEPSGPEATTSASVGPTEAAAAEELPALEKPEAAVAAAPVLSLPEPDLRRPERPVAGVAGTPEAPAMGPIAVARATPSGATTARTGLGPRSMPVPDVYRSRLDPNRSTLARRAGASVASEQAVERGLDWLKRHQDADGRWDGGTARDLENNVIRGQSDFTKHCPAGEICFGECRYYDADTALTGLALLAYLGAGYTHADGKYAEVVGNGVDFLLKSQAASGDLRGESRAVGMYCHAMASLALCEAYALTGDERLRDPVERAVGFLVKGQAKDGMAWRYEPGAPSGDTSILGWVILVLKSARVVGIPVPQAARTGSVAWLSKVSSGKNGGLARYQPAKPVTPTMTAEAWVCRQFLGIGGPGLASTEASNHLLTNGPPAKAFNIYYWYYGTLAMYQQGGQAWARWNVQVRDGLVARQRNSGHQSGSWDPDESEYGPYGGRIYTTALATLTLEVYYRFLRLYEAPEVAPADPPIRRAGVPPQPIISKPAAGPRPAATR
ncbi:hypothetical protein EP7_002673 [Isosphaeraceae bacterium EP7]